MLNDVLEISALDQNTPILYDTASNINFSCYASIEQVEDAIKPGVELIFKPSRPDLIIRTNPERVTQLLTQLLHNAAKFTRCGRITLNYEIVGEEIVYSITDTGIGIPEEEQEHIFERFVKLDSFTQGTGLGLSLCRSLAERLGGTLVIDKQYKNGCRFLLTLPFIISERS